jgi:hypothetical protein
VSRGGAPPRAFAVSLSGAFALPKKEEAGDLALFSFLSFASLVVFSSKRLDRRQADALVWLQITWLSFLATGKSVLRVCGYAPRFWSAG